jgi:hypothetical protein
MEILCNPEKKLPEKFRGLGEGEDGEQHVLPSGLGCRHQDIRLNVTRGICGSPRKVAIEVCGTSVMPSGIGLSLRIKCLISRSARPTIRLALIAHIRYLQFLVQNDLLALT